ncbi:hypothetical protein SVAN01_04520 [Stagonosporopsis vannaccii]|nr:hypothetical protein SVAN01_04520 [Stagonosporopsis vannaccii]
MSLCFLEAFVRFKSGAIPEQEFLDNLLAHFRGTRHREDEKQSNGEPLANFEPWMASLRDVALAGDYKPLEDTSNHETLLSLCLQGRFEKFKAAINSSRAPEILQPLACIAAQRGNIEILQACLDQGAKFDRYLTRASQISARGNVAFLKFLLAHNWANVQNSTEAVREQIKHFGAQSLEAECLRESARGDLADERIGGRTRTTSVASAEAGDVSTQASTNVQLDEIDKTVNW